MKSLFQPYIVKLFFCLGLLLLHSGSLNADDFYTRKGHDGTINYFFKNKPPCQKRADYVKSNQFKAKLSASYHGIGAGVGGEYQNKWQQIRPQNPTYELFSDVIFDICFEYGVGRMNREQYLQQRDHYMNIRDELLFIKADTSGKPTPIVLLMDSPVDKVVYNPNLRKTGATNADEITEILDDLQILLPVEKTSLRWHRTTQVKKLNPDLIVIHFSAFESDTVDCQVGAKQNACNSRFLYFFKSLRRSKSKVLVYSRTPGFSDTSFKERFLRWVGISEKSFKERVTLFGMRDQGRKPRFDDPDTAMAFKQTIVEILGIENN